MANNGTQKSAFDIPTQSLAVKSNGDEGSAAWMKRISKEHGDTNPQKLEKRRERLSVLAAQMERDLKAFQMSKKVYLVRNQKLQDEAIKKLKTLPQDGKDFSDVSEQLGQIQLERQAQEQNYELLIGQKISNMAMVEGMCLIVDCMTLRESVKSKSGKVGLLRFSSALYACDGAWYAGKSYRRIKKLYDVMAAQNPLLAGSLDAEDDEEEGEDTVYDDEDVVTEEDRKKIKEDLGEEL